MNWKPERFLRVCVFGLLMVLAWSVWAAATQNTNPAATSPGEVSATNFFGGPGDLLAGQVKSHEDYLTFGLDRVPLFKTHQLLGQPLWKYLASIVFILLAFYVSKFLDFLTNVWLKRWSSRTDEELNKLLVRLLRGPVKVIAFVLFLNVGLDIFDWGTVAQAYLSKGFIVVVAVSLTYVALKVIDLFIGLWRQRTAGGSDKAFDDHLFPVLSKSLKIFAVTVAVLVTCSNLGINITGALASLSVGALAVGLAAQDTLANLFGAIAVYIDRPFRIGDLVRLENIEGTVESIGLRSTRVRSLDGNHVTIPNKTVGNATITNVSRRQNIKLEMNLALSGEMSAPQVRRALAIVEDVCRAHPMTADFLVSFNKFADSTMNVAVVHWWKGTDGKAQAAGIQEMNLRIKERFDAEGIRMAVPTRKVLLHQDSSSAQ